MVDRREATAAVSLEHHLCTIAAGMLTHLRSALARLGELEISTKVGPYDLVTDADRSIESWLWNTTHEVYPDDGFLGEEGGWIAPPDSGRYWVADPVDGTMNFANGLPWACSSIAVVAENKALAGVIVDPFRDEIYLTSGGGRSELNGKRITVASSSLLAGKVVLLEVQSGASISAMGEVEDVVRAMGGTARAMGSGALAMALVAAGRAQAVAHAGPSLWDIAAGAALVEQAGGVVLGTSGEYELGVGGPLVAGSREVCEILQAPLARIEAANAER